jgi:hypothetical protein
MGSTRWVAPAGGKYRLGGEACRLIRVKAQDSACFWQKKKANLAARSFKF